MNEDLILTLQNYWFSEKEAKIYLTALSLWAAPASSIARNANESRTTVYSVLWDLVKKWFCSTVVRENVTYFSAVSPEMLVKIQEQKYKSLQEKLPEFMAIWSMFWWHSKIKTFEWNSALKNMFLELATTEVDPKFFQWNFEIKANKNLFPEEELIKPVYQLPTGYQNYLFHNLALKSLKDLEGKVYGLVPYSLMNKYRLINKEVALNYAHNPKNLEEVRQSYRYLKYEEALTFSLKNQ